MNNSGLSLRHYLEKLQIIVDPNYGRLRKTMPSVIFVIALALGFFLFFDRYPLFHDEIINAFKAHTGLVFDYALRPVFYFLNYFFYHFLGNAPRSLTVAAVIYYAVTAALLYAIGQRHFGLLGGFLCSFIFMFMPLVIHTGIRGMPHLPAGLFAVVILYFLSKLFGSSSQKKVGWYMLTIGIFGVITLATHPTMMGVASALVAWAVFGLVFNGRYFSIFYPCGVKRKHYVLLLVSFIVSFALLNLLYLYFDGRSYLSLLLAGIGKTNNPVYSGYFQPWNWYLSELLKHGSIINIIVILFVFYYFIVRLICRDKFVTDSSEYSFLFTILFATVIFLVFISLSKWKFARVFVSFIPFYALAAGLVISFVVKWLIKYKNTVIYSLFPFLLILSGGVWGVVSFYDYAAGVKENIHNEKERYYGLYDQIININSPNIGMVGDKSQQVFALRYITLADKTTVKLADNLRGLIDDKDRNELIQAFFGSNVEYFMIPTGRKSSRDQVSQDYINTFSQLVSIGATKQYSWRGLYELWNYELIPQSSDFYKYLSVATPRSRIGVYGTKEEVGEEYFKRFNSVSGKFNLRIYPLVSKSRTAERNMEFLDRNNVSMLLLPIREVAGIKNEKLNEMKQYLRAQSWKLADTADNMELELWMRNVKQEWAKE